MNQVTVLSNSISRYEDRIGGGFKPDNRFYSKVGINPKRFGQLIRGEKPIYGFEALNLSKFFGVPVEDLCKNESPNTAPTVSGQSSNL